MSVDRLSLWHEFFPMENITIETVFRGFLFIWMSRFGVPSILKTDQRKPFESALFLHVTSLLGCSRFRTSAYNPAENRLIERFHRRLQTALWAQILFLRLGGQPDYCASWITVSIETLYWMHNGRACLELSTLLFSRAYRAYHPWKGVPHLICQLIKVYNVNT